MKRKKKLPPFRVAVVHFYTNGEKIFGACNEDDDKSLEEPKHSDAERFVRDFDFFERKFYEYIDSIVYSNS